ncbi:hypothetical protein [uncultured Alteromonas sp.]|uniref:hypothetical protein n=1 Tax=uncultured Alteromonas sp. TaxID=179113 RepID=UPI0030CF34F3|tara:strand:+ start:18897 stop:19118 length:222 start_codon:yes stop_codon:yes gene_type:complete
MTVNELHRTANCFLVGAEDRDGQTEWYKVVSLSPLSSMCQADLYQSLKETLSLNTDDIISVVDINTLPVLQHK